MKRYLRIFAFYFAGCLIGGSISVATNQPLLSAQDPVSVQAPVSVPIAKFKHKNHLRGARSSRSHWLAAQATNNPDFKHFAKSVVPSEFVPAIIPKPSQMSYWGNQNYGNCVTAEEFFSKCIYPVYFSNTGTMLDMPESLAVEWAGWYGYLNGANLTPVMDTMINNGVIYDKWKYKDAKYHSVDYTNWSILTSAISTGPVKIGVASSQFDNVQGVGDNNGWVMYGFSQDTNEDHCVSLIGYGTMSYLATKMEITLPSGVDGTAKGCLLYTWSTIGLIDYQSLLNIEAEAWVRTPTTPTPHKVVANTPAVPLKSLPSNN